MHLGARLGEAVPPSLMASLCRASQALWSQGGDSALYSSTTGFHMPAQALGS